jgi:hypothetical protein
MQFNDMPVRRVTSVALLLLSLLLTPHITFADGDFGLLDHRGNFHQLSRYRDHAAVIVLPFSYNDEPSLQLAEQVSALAPQLAEQSVSVWLLNASDEPALIRSRTASPGNFPVLIDSSQTVAKTLEVKHLGEFLILDPISMGVLYRGFDDISLLESVLTEALAAKSIGRPSRLEQSTDVLDGTTLTYRFIEQLAGRKISYQTEIAPLLKARCAYCHVENGLAPWAMNRYIMILGWSPMMREVVITRRMPPGQIDNSVGNWLNTHELSDEEMALLVEWIDQRGPREAGESDPLAEPLPVATEWPRGQPDLIIDVPEQFIPATGNIDFLVKRVALDLPDDRWINAIAYQVGDKSVLHSLLVYAVDKSMQSTDPDAMIAGEHAEFISVYVPGESDDAFGEQAGYLLGKNKDLVFKLRYLTSGRETLDRTRIGLYFSNGTPERRIRTLALEKPEFTIPANTAMHREVMESEPLDSDMLLESYSPHAHSRGRSMAVSVRYPDGREEALINIPNFNYNWQLAYRTSEQILIPAGSVFKVETVYDNSASNPFNPAPEQTLGQGYRVDSEMFSHFIRMAE